jgi:hypothetical protein
MPITCKLLGPDGKTASDGKSEIQNVQVSDTSGNVVKGQPTSQAAESFTVTLPAGDYIIFIALGKLSTAQSVWVVEDCPGATKLDWIAVPGTNTPHGNFPLKVL